MEKYLMYRDAVWNKNEWFFSTDINYFNFIKLLNCVSVATYK